MIQRITPHLTVNGAGEALTFYARAFGAREVMRIPAEDGSRLLHAEFRVNDGVVMLSDADPEREEPSPQPGCSGSVALVLTFDRPGDVDMVFHRAVGTGCTVRQEPADMFWGARFAEVEDPFGHRWMLSGPLPQE